MAEEHFFPPNQLSGTRKHVVTHVALWMSSFLFCMRTWLHMCSPDYNSPCGVTRLCSVFWVGSETRFQRWLCSSCFWCFHSVLSEVSPQISCQCEWGCCSLQSQWVGRLAGEFSKSSKSLDGDKHMLTINAKGTLLEWSSPAAGRSLTRWSVVWFLMLKCSWARHSTSTCLVAPDPGLRTVLYECVCVCVCVKG